MQISSPISFRPSLRRLRADRRLPRRIRRAAAALKALPREDLSPGEAWIEDHAGYLMEEAASLIREAASLPPLPARAGAPRLLPVVRKICGGETGEISERVLYTALKAREEEYTWAELCALPVLLRFALLEQLNAALKRCVRAPARRREALAAAQAFADKRREALPSGEGLLAQTLECLSRMEDPAALSQADELMRKAGRSAEEICRRAQDTRTREGLETERLIQSLRALPRLAFGRLAERLSPAAQCLSREDTYRAMDGPSRGYYLQCAARIARRCRVTESSAARSALALAQGQEGERGQAGYYLLRRPDLLRKALGRRAPALSENAWQRLFLLPLYLGAAAGLAALLLLGVPWFGALPGVLCLSEILRIPYFSLLRRAYPARMLPRLRFRQLPESARTLAAVPTLLSSRRQALQAARHLAVLRSANPELDYLLLSDFADGPQVEEAEDQEILLALREAISALNRQYGGGFYCLHRRRQWDEGQGAFCGRERKRGALEALNRLIQSGQCRDSFAFSSCEPASLKGRYAYVITLDADTFLPPGAARELIGAMAHPLQKGRLAVIQPRMEVAPDRVRTRAQKGLGGQGGADPYHLSVQDVYQDVFGRGSFVGKGIYDPALWLSRLEGRLPEGRLLSHDLIEGEIAGCALASDIALFDGHPARLSGWVKRLHRWTRGDWQLLPFLADRRLSLLSRHKIWDNLRRSLLPAAQVTAALLGARLGNPLLLLLALPWPLRGLVRRFSLLPGKALVCLDGALRALYRQFFSHKKLLSWVTAAQAESGGGMPLSCQAGQALIGAGLIALSLLPGGLWYASLGGVLWAAGPLLIPLWDGPADAPRPMTPLMEAQARTLARETWRFFTDSVDASTRFLPPDNVQQDPPRGRALRTSPTNIGLYLLSCCAARELGLISTGEMAERLENTVKTLEKMKKWKGHLYNWYDLRDLSPLPPAFVSTVDSGNLAACLLCCAQLCRGRLEEMPKEALSLPARLDGLARRMDFSALYDTKRQLFSIGWEEKNGRLAPGRYDLMASEACLTSFTAILLGQVPLRHWRRLNRAVTLSGGGPALLSWGGTMFEYLLPALFLPLIPGTLLGEGCRAAARAQIAAAGHRPFGISESGYYAFDPDMNYQYRAFGLPALALSPDTAGQVVAPYASLLALPFFPRAAGENMLRMRRLSWYDFHGFFEAADYAPSRVEKGPHIVKSHMAHHQGMILCALCNALRGNALSRAFLQPPEARACAYLLWEKAPSRARRRPALPPPRREEISEGKLSRRAYPGLPLDAQALSGGNTCWVMTENGQGFLHWGDMMVTRFRPEADAQTGPQFYLRDGLTGAFCRIPVRGRAVFEAGAVRYETAFNGLRASLCCCVDPLSGMAAAALRLENPGGTPRQAEAVSFLEIAQGPQRDDLAHPNYRDLSVQVRPFGSRGLCARRLPRDEKEAALPLIYHAAAGDVSALCRQGDRLLFIGPGGSYESPEQLARSAEDCFFRTGDVIAPCLSLRALIRLDAGAEANVYFLTLFSPAGQEPEEGLLSPARARAAFSLAAVRSRMALRQLKIDPRGLFLYQQMLGAALFSGQPHSCARLPAPRDTLWKNGLSGDLPLLLLRLSDRGDAALIRHALRAHAWMRQQGIPTDLVIFCPEEDAYFRPCRAAAEAQLAAGWDREMLGAWGGVHIVSGTEEEADQLESLSRLTLRSGRPLSAQLSALRVPPPKAPACRLTVPEPQGAPPLSAFNSFGGFAEDGAYWTLRPAPAPYFHLLSGESFGTLVCDRGILHSFGDNSRLDRLTRLCPDPHLAPPSEEIYLIDEENRAFPLTRCAAVYAPGTAEYRLKAADASVTVTVFVPRDQALGVRSVEIKSDRGGAYRLVWLVRFGVGDGSRETRCRAERDYVFAFSGEGKIGWAALAGASARALSPARAFGLSGDGLPPALEDMPSDGGSAAALTCGISLRPRRAQRLTLALGLSDTEASARAAYAALLAQGAGEAERAVRALWSRRLSGLQLFFGDAPLERMMNVWLPYQVWAARLLARMGPYQVGGAIGFRDQLQDLLAILYTHPDFARAHILLCAAHQFPEGDVQHWWHSPARGVRTRISDDRLFLPFLTARYVSVTGDESILSEKTPYLSSPPLAPEEKERYEAPSVTNYADSLLVHCRRALDSVAFGVHGLPLMGGGDWNDGMNRVGGEGGESVWLGFFLILTLGEFAPLCAEEEKARYDRLRRDLLTASDRAWTGKWYLRAWYDGGKPLGGPDTDPPRIDLITQCFAVLAGAPKNKARDAVKRAVELLYDRDGGIVKLLDPPFAPGEQAGYIGAYLPGVRENGGQYTHAVPWLILALCALNESVLAWEIARAVLPERHADAREKALRYRGEPYVLSGDVYAGENRGRAGWSWYTGSAAWLYYAVITGLLGFEKKGNRARLRPLPTPEGEEFTLSCRFGDSLYHFTAARDALFPTLDGARLSDGWAEIKNDGRTHEARFPLPES